MAELIGAEYRACVELTNKAGETVADVGESCDRVNLASLGWLLEQRLIVPVIADREAALLDDAFAALMAAEPELQA